MKAFGRERNSSEKNLWYLNCSQKVCELFQTIEGIIQSRGERLKKFVRAGGVYLQKTIHR